jgi:hypothetical protein
MNTDISDEMDTTTKEDPFSDCSANIATNTINAFAQGLGDNDTFGNQNRGSEQPTTSYTSGSVGTLGVSFGLNTMNTFGSSAFMNTVNQGRNNAFADFGATTNSHSTFGTRTGPTNTFGTSSIFRSAPLSGNTDNTNSFGGGMALSFGRTGNTMTGLGGGTFNGFGTLGMFANTTPSFGGNTIGNSAALFSSSVGSSAVNPTNTMVSSSFTLFNRGNTLAPAATAPFGSTIQSGTTINEVSALAIPLQACPSLNMTSGVQLSLSKSTNDPEENFPSSPSLVSLSEADTASENPRSDCENKGEGEDVRKDRKETFAPMSTVEKDEVLRMLDGYSSDEYEQDEEEFLKVSTDQENQAGTKIAVQEKLKNEEDAVRSDHLLPIAEFRSAGSENKVTLSNEIHNGEEAADVDLSPFESQRNFEYELPIESNSDDQLEEGLPDILSLANIIFGVAVFSERGQILAHNFNSLSEIHQQALMNSLLMLKPTILVTPSTEVQLELASSTLIPTANPSSITEPGLAADQIPADNQSTSKESAAAATKKAKGRWDEDSEDNLRKKRSRGNDSSSPPSNQLTNLENDQNSVYINDDRQKTS